MSDTNAIFEAIQGTSNVFVEAISDATKDAAMTTFMVNLAIFNALCRQPGIDSRKLGNDVIAGLREFAGENVTPAVSGNLQMMANAIEEGQPE